MFTNYTGINGCAYGTPYHDMFIHGAGLPPVTGTPSALEPSLVVALREGSSSEGSSDSEEGLPGITEEQIKWMEDRDGEIFQLEEDEPEIERLTPAYQAYQMRRASSSVTTPRRTSACQPSPSPTSNPIPILVTPRRTSPPMMGMEGDETTTAIPRVPAWNSGLYKA